MSFASCLLEPMKNDSGEALQQPAAEVSMAEPFDWFDCGLGFVKIVNDDCC